MRELPVDCSNWSLRSDGWILNKTPRDMIYKKTAVCVLLPESGENTFSVICKERAGQEIDVHVAQTYSIIRRQHDRDEITVSFWHLLDWRGPPRERTVIRSLTHTWLFDRTPEGYESARRVVGATRRVLDTQTSSDFDTCLKHHMAGLPAAQLLSKEPINEANESGVIARNIGRIAFSSGE